MRDNIKPIEAGFFKYCMRNLSHEYYYNCDARIRDGKHMRDLMNDYSEANNIPFKVIINTVNKWDANGIFEWGGDIWGIFHTLNFPLEYIMLIPRRVLRKVPAFGRVMITTKAVDYNTVFTFKTMANGLKDTMEINETRADYWYMVNYHPEKYKSALQHINKIVDGTKPYDRDFLIAYIRYVMNSYSIDNFKDGSSVINDTIHTLKKFIKFANENDKIKHDMHVSNNINFIDKVSDFVSKIFNEINC